MKKISYVCMFVIGGILSLTMLLDLFDIPCWASVVCSFMSMLGSGVLCSSLVSFLIEKQNEARDKKLKSEQREYLIRSVKYRFMRLCEREFSEMSYYYSNYILHNNTKLSKSDFTIEHIGCSICDLLKKIEQNETIKKASTSEIIVSPETIKFSATKFRHLVSSNTPYYNSLIQSLTDLSVDYPLLLSTRIFTDTDIENLKELASLLEDVIRFSSEMDLEDGTVLEFKKILFEQTSSILSSLNISADTVISCIYKPVA